jgi:3-hydroxybutyrate dehydrogenase
MLNGKTALITGSTSGIGLGIARKLSEKGANIIINGLGEKSEIQKLCSEISSAYGTEVVYDDANMTKPEEIESMCEGAISKFGAVDILVNNAGIQFVSKIEEFPPDKWDNIIAINLSSAFHTIRCLVPAMRDKKWGRIINVASAHGLVASPYKSAYVAAKHGMIGLTKTVALETVRDNITCNAICPGYVLTPLVEGQIKDQAKAHNMKEDEVIEKIILDPQPTKKFIQIDEVAKFAIFLCDEAAQGITGTSQSIDGGWTAR